MSSNNCTPAVNLRIGCIFLGYVSTANLVYNFEELKSIDEEGEKTLLLGYNAILNNNGKVLVVNNRFNLMYFKEVSNELSALNILKI